MEKKNTLPSGFGDRLKRERKRLGHTQDSFCALVGVSRFTQHMYESETNTPNVKYLALLFELGADINFLLFGNQSEKKSALSEDDIIDVEKKSFELIEINENSMGQKLDAEKRFEIFRVIRSQLIQSKLSEMKVKSVA